MYLCSCHFIWLYFFPAMYPGAEWQLNSTVWYQSLCATQAADWDDRPSKICLDWFVLLALIPAARCLLSRFLPADSKTQSCSVSRRLWDADMRWKCDIWVSNYSLDLGGEGGVLNLECHSFRPSALQQLQTGIFSWNGRVEVCKFKNPTSCKKYYTGFTNQFQKLSHCQSYYYHQYKT